jgi:ectoine hydroxylase-related dioxygenase (phytanoyl-CoA dioxygenase family)
MKARATPQQIQHYRDQGFVVIEDLLSPAEVVELRAAVDEALEVIGDDFMGGFGKRRVDPTPKVDPTPDAGPKERSYYNRVFLQKVNLWKVSETVKRYIAGPEVGRIASDLVGCDLRVWHDQTLQKTPWANPTAWHMDNPYHSFHSPNEISIWIALDDATPQNGCMHYLPGAHKRVTYRNSSIGPNFAEFFEVYPELQDIMPVAAPMRAGTCGFHSGLTPHCAGPNITPHWRRAMTCIYMPTGATFNGNGNILSAERIAKLKIGDSLDDETEHPLITPRDLVGAAR